MVGRLRRRSQSSPVLRIAVLLSLVTLVRYVAPSFSLFGSWEGDIDDIKALPRDIGFDSVNGVIADNGKVKLAIDDGHLHARYADGPLSIEMDDTRAWEADYKDGRTKLKLVGQGSDDLYWEASKQSTFKGLGNVEVNFTSDQDFGLQVEPTLPNMLGAELKAKVRSSGKGVSGRLESQRKLLENIDLSYSVENNEGGYDLNDLSHTAQLRGSLSGGSFDAKLDKTSQGHHYNASYHANLDNFLRGDASAVVGFDNDGAYGSVSKSHNIGKALRGSYRASGRSGFGDDDSIISQSARLTHDLGSLEIRKVADEPLMASLQSDITHGPTRLQGQLDYSFEEEAPDFNLTLSRDISEALRHLSIEGEVQAGIDDASIDGLYGKLAAKRNLGKGLALQYLSQGRGNSADHSLKLTNPFGHAELVKSTDAAPRLRVGYQVEV